MLNYSVCDATNPASMLDVATAVEVPVSISTEGLILYFTDSELDQYYDGIHAILTEHGEMYVTGDIAMTNQVSNKVAAISLGAEGEIGKKFLENGLKSLSDTDTNHNFLMQSSKEEITKYLEGKGFIVEWIPFDNCIPDFESTKNLPLEAREKINNIFRPLEYLKLSVDLEKKSNTDFSSKFSMNFDLDNGSLKITLSGRLDSVTATDFLKKYEEIKEPITAVTIDLTRLAYVSSAGLRVFMIIFKALENKENFRLQNAGEAVKEILRTTGFAEIFGE